MGRLLFSSVCGPQYSPVLSEVHFEEMKSKEKKFERKENMYDDIFLFG